MNEREIKEFDFQAEIYSKRENKVPVLTQYDTSIALNFFITSKGECFNLLNSIVKVRFTINGEVLEQQAEIIDAELGVSRILIDPGLTTKTGKVQALLDIFDSHGHKYSALSFELSIVPYLGDDGNPMEHDSYPILNQLIQEVSAMSGTYADLFEANRLEMEKFKAEILREVDAMISTLDKIERDTETYIAEAIRIE